MKAPSSSRWLVYAGATLALAIAGLWIASAPWVFRWWYCRDFPYIWCVSCGAGQISIARDNPMLRFGDIYLPPLYPSRERARHLVWLPAVTWRSDLKCVQMPLWIPLLLVIAATAWLWLRLRSTPAGHCRTCGYDLTGNVSGRCPECGSPATEFLG
jgi:hypothetical protein